MFRKRSKTPPRVNNKRSARFRNNSWKKPWNPVYKGKSKSINRPANNTIAEVNEHYFDCSNLREADR